MSIEDDIAFLERVPMLAVLGRDALRILAIGAESRYVHDGVTLFKAGDQADAAYVVQEGSFELAVNGGASPTNAGVGVLIGELALVTETSRSMTATAREPSSVIRIPRSLFLKMLEGYPEAARRLRDAIAQRVNATARDLTKVRTGLDRGGAAPARR
jgi:CRP-like cAMP-binding protein